MQVYPHSMHPISNQDDIVTSSIPCSSMTSSPDSPNNIPSVSSFIKNSDALLHPSSPPTSQPYSCSSQDGYAQSPEPGNALLTFNGNKHLSMSPMGSHDCETKTLMTSYQRCRSSSLSLDQCSLPSSPTSSCRSPSSCAITQLQQPCASTLSLSKPPCVKSEIIETPFNIPSGYLRRPANGDAVSFNERQYPAYSSDAVCENKVNGRLPTTCTSENFQIKNSIVPKSEKPYPHYDQDSPSFRPCKTLDSENALHTSVQPFFPPHQINFPSIMETADNESLSNSSNMHLQDHAHPHMSSMVDARFRSNEFCHKRSHPYLPLGISFPMAVNGTTPYRPRFSRRNNPELEKKRIHKCNHQGKIA